MYGATPELTTALTGLARETKAKGWWHAYGDTIPDWFELYVGLESGAGRLREHDDTLIPGLLQTRDYASGVYQHRSGMTDDEWERLVEVRLQRQGLLHRRLPLPPRLDVMLSEAALLRVVGGPAAMAEQLRYLAEIGRLPHVSIRVVPLAAGLHFGAVAGSIVILNFPLGSRVEPEPSVVYSESLTGALYLDRKEELAAYERIWASLDSLALDEGQSRQLIIKISEEVHHG
ncbi:DUF5753 domain-containing protein [Micromonospora sp. WMMA2032]|uniref:DUF5753 domain-containing protein n=1 Tax=Micromonospora sp. WMMA2032 TaxID=2039870 RepID=UPI00352E2E4D